MRVLVLSHADVTRLLTMPECIAQMEDALASLARGEAHQPLRMIVMPPGAAGDMALMPSYFGGKDAAFDFESRRRGFALAQAAARALALDLGELVAIDRKLALEAARRRRSGLP